MDDRMEADRKIIYDEAILAKAKKQHSRILTDEEKDRALTLCGLGYTQAEVQRRLHVGHNAWALTKQADANFTAKWKEIQDARVESVEQELVRLALGGSKVIQTHWQAVVDRRGNVQIDPATGNPVMRLMRKQVTHHPPTLESIMCVLRARKPEVYAQRKPDQGENVMDSMDSPDEVRRKLLEKLTELKRRNAPLT